MDATLTPGRGRAPVGAGADGCRCVHPDVMQSSSGAMTADGTQDRIHALAELIVRFGANVQPGQIVSIGSEPGKEPLARAIAEAAYKAGAKFVDLSVFDIHIKHARMLYADPDTLAFVPPWYGERLRTLGELRSAAIALTGPGAP